jgi:hypothetical protein
VVLTLKIMDFENVTLTKVIHIYLIEDMNVIKIYLYLTYDVKLHIQKEKLKVINQHKNDICDM